MLMPLLFAFVAGCQQPPAGPPKSPNVRIEGPAGTPLGYSVSYFDSPDKVSTSGGMKIIPPTGVFTEDLQGGHDGVMVQVIPNRSAFVTVILLDGERELQRASASTANETVQVRAGKANPVGPKP